MKKLRIIKKVFDLLHKAVCEKFEENCAHLKVNPPANKGKYYGYSHSRPTSEPNLHDFMMENFKVAEYLAREKANLGRKAFYRIWNKFDKLKGNSEELPVENLLLTICCLYLGYTDIHSFLEATPNLLPADKEMQRLRWKYQQGAITPLANQYRAYYFSYRQNKIKYFTLVIDFVNYNGTGYPARLTGLHNAEVQEGFDDRSYTGYAKKIGAYLSINLADKEYPLNILGYIGDRRQPDKPNLIFCSFQAISVFSHPFCAEAVLLKLRQNSQEEWKPIIPGNVDLVKLYLRIQRRNFRVPSREPTSLSGLTARHIHLRSLAQRIKGTFRIWNFSQRGRIIQSRFTIEEDFGATLETMPNDIQNEQKQVCVFSLSLARSDKLCISSHVEEGVSVINYAIVDIESPDRNGILDGVFSSVGPPDLGVITDYLVACREKDDYEFEVTELRREDVSRLVRENPSLEALRQRLFDLVRNRRGGFSFLDGYAS